MSLLPSAAPSISGILRTMVCPNGSFLRCRMFHSVGVNPPFCASIFFKTSLGSSLLQTSGNLVIILVVLTCLCAILVYNIWRLFQIVSCLYYLLISCVISDSRETEVYKKNCTRLPDSYGCLGVLPLTQGLYIFLLLKYFFPCSKVFYKILHFILC